MKIPAPHLTLRAFRSLAIPLPLVLLSCSTLVGNVKPVDEKSTSYWVTDLSAEAPRTWMKLDSKAVAEAGEAVNPESEAFSNEVSDLAFQSKKTAAIISLNSACRKGREDQVNLQTFSHELILGIHSVKDRDEKPIEVAGQKALQATVEGRMAGEETKIRTVVLQKRECVYDLMYIARPERFSAHEADFSRFVSSLQLR